MTAGRCFLTVESSMSIARGAVMWIGVASVFLPSVRECAAQVGHRASTIEWRVADADIIVRASVAEVTGVPVEQPDDGVYRNPEVAKTVTVNVHETLKGEHADSLLFTDRTSASDKIYEGWKTAGGEQLWFFTRVGKPKGKNDADATPRRVRFSQDSSVIRLGPPVPEEKDFSPPPAAFFTVDLKVVKEPKDILAATRAAVAETPKQGWFLSHRVNLPRAVMEATGRSGDANDLVAPVDHRLEAAARQWIATPEEVPLRLGISKDDATRYYSGAFQCEGARALRFFKSRENAAILKRLLDSPAFYEEIRAGDDGQVVPVRKVYHVRKAAYEALQEWEVEVVQPVLTEELTPK